MAQKTLFDQIRLGNLVLKNRLIRSATWAGLAEWDGAIPKELYQSYATLAKGGVGAIITGFTSVADEDHFISGMARLSHDSLIAQHQKLTAICHSENCPVLAQIALGEYAGGIEPNQISEADIHTVTDMFVQASLRAQKAGYDGVQIHAAHGFFLSRFISPAHNHRQDGYGGSAHKRAQILLDILAGIRLLAPSLHISIKINCSDFLPHGVTPKESLMICKQLASCGIDSIEVSGNGTSRVGIKAGVNEAYFKEFALLLAEEVDTPIILVGGHRSREHMEIVLNAGRITALSLSRPLIREPSLPMRWQKGDTAPAKCVSCNMCYQTSGHTCIFHVMKNNAL